MNRPLTVIGPLRGVIKAVLPRVLGSVLAVAVTGLYMQGFATAALAQIDISGDWTTTFTGVFSGQCNATITQTGIALSTELECDFPGSGTLNGTIDPADGSFNQSGLVGGFPVQIQGTASADSSTLQGTWEALGFTGTFTGHRGQTALPTPPPTVACSAALSGTACIQRGGGDVAGAQLPDAGSVAADEELGSELVLTFLAGSAAVLSFGAWAAWRRSRRAP